MHFVKNMPYGLYQKHPSALFYIYYADIFLATWARQSIINKDLVSLKILES